jgi:hypothetical protein
LSVRDLSQINFKNHNPNTYKKPNKYSQAGSDLEYKELLDVMHEKEENA